MPETAVLIFCTRCKTKTESNNVENVTTKNGRPATQAKCSVCQTKKFLIGKHLG